MKVVRTVSCEYIFNRSTKLYQPNKKQDLKTLKSFKIEPAAINFNFKPTQLD